MLECNKPKISQSNREAIRAPNSFYHCRTGNFQMKIKHFYIAFDPTSHSSNWHSVALFDPSTPSPKDQMTDLNRPVENEGLGMQDPRSRRFNCSSFSLSCQGFIATSVVCHLRPLLARRSPFAARSSQLEVSRFSSSSVEYQLFFYASTSKPSFRKTTPIAIAPRFDQLFAFALYIFHCFKIALMWLWLSSPLAHTMGTQWAGNCQKEGLPFITFSWFDCRFVYINIWS